MHAVTIGPNGREGEQGARRRPYEFSGVNIFRFDGAGKLAEIWNHRDDLGLMEQLGARVFAGAPARQA